MKRLLFLLILFMTAQPLYCGTTAEDEIYLGTQENKQFTELFLSLIDKDPELSNEIKEIGNKIIVGIERKEIPYEFHTIDLDEYNSFAFPGGYIYVTEKLWKILDKNEKAALLAHEVGHVDARHVINSTSKKKTRDTTIDIVSKIAGVRGLYRMAVNYVNDMFVVKYTPKNEEDADERAVNLCNLAGYDPASNLCLVRKIKRILDLNGKDSNVLKNLYASHPCSEQRIKDIESYLATSGFDIPAEETGEIIPDFLYVGDVSKVKSENKNGFDTKITFVKSTSKTADRAGLDIGSVVWVMRDGWDWKYENKMPHPAGRAVITNFGFASDALVQTQKL